MTLTHQASGQSPDNLPVVSYASPGDFTRRVTVFFLQISQRVGAIALFATIAVWAFMFLIRDFHVPLAIACGCADVGLCSALIARMMTHAGTPDRREATGVAFFNLVLFVLAVYLMVFARLDVIRSGASEFFTPTPPTSSQTMTPPK